MTVRLPTNPDLDGHLVSAQGRTTGRGDERTKE